MGSPVFGLQGETIGKQMKKRGYNTHMVGKWHLGHAKFAYTPLQNGFDSFLGIYGGGADHWTYHNGKEFDLHRNGRGISGEGVHSSMLFAGEAMSIIEDANEDPFFLYLAFMAPHDPLQPHPLHLDQCGHIENEIRRKYCGLVVGLDEGVGNVTEALERAGKLDNTIIVFSTDNGGLPWVGGLNYPYRGTKTSSFEGGIRGPAFVYGPKFFTEAGYTFDGMVHICDWMPTLLSLVDQHASIDEKSEYHSSIATDALPMDGVDLSHALSGNHDSPRNDVVTRVDIFANATSYRYGDWKLVLGVGGTLRRYLEPSGKWLVDNPTIVDRFVECTLDVLERLLGSRAVPIQYLVLLYRVKLEDLFLGTYTATILAGPASEDTQFKYFDDSYPVIEWDKPGKVFLFNLADDPYEENNLAFSNREQVNLLAGELRKHLKGAPGQYIGDESHVGAPPSSKYSHFWLKDDVDITTLETGPGIFRKTEKLFNLGIALILCSILIMIYLSIRCMRRCLCSKPKPQGKRKID